MTTTAEPIAPPTPDLTEAKVSAPPAAVNIDKSLVDLACLGDQEALHAILRQFIDPGERIEWCDYLGTLGIQPFGLKSFALLTARRIGTLRIGWFGYVLYQDAPLEYTVSGMVVQPSKFGLYLWLVINTLVLLVADYALFTILVRPMSLLGVATVCVAALVLAVTWVMTVRVYYKLNKCGLLWAVREGLWVYAFANRGRMNVANRLHRLTLDLRERRVRDVSPLP
jgi:hypothetical protein